MKLKNYKDQVVWIIGASSGIGRALAVKLASQGARLALSARRKDELDRLTTTLGQAHKSFALDVTDAELCANTASTIQALFGRIDRIIFLAAAYMPMKLDALDLAATKQIIDVNLLGAFHIISAILPLLKEQGFGQIALCGSVSGYTGLPGGQPYGASKAGIINLAESLHAELPRGIDVKLISPGFVRTALTDKNNFEMPMIINAEQAAKNIACGLLTSRFEIHFPKRFTFLLKLLPILPYLIALKITQIFK